MTDEDRVPFAEAMHVLAETMGEPVSDIRAEGYFAALSDLPFEAVKAAVLTAVRTCRFFPKPVELLELVTGTVGDAADAAWGEVIREVQTVGYLGTPCFTDGRTLPAICSVWGGWRRLCEVLPADGPELVGWIKQFKGAFGSVHGRSIHAAIAAGLAPELGRAIERLSLAKQMLNREGRLPQGELGDGL